MTNSRLTDPEVLEWRYPVRLERTRSARQRRPGPLAGRHGGPEIRFLEPMTVTMLSGHRGCRRTGWPGAGPGRSGGTGSSTRTGQWCR